MKLRGSSCAFTLTLFVVFGAGNILAQNASVKGSGTNGHLAKWFDINTLGDSGVVEIGGNIGIGTLTPSSKLTVAGGIEANVTGPGVAVQGSSSQGTGVKGSSNSGFGLHGESATGNALFAVSQNGFAGVFLGEVSVTSNQPTGATLTLVNTADHGGGLVVLAGASSIGIGGAGISSKGGDANVGPGGDGIRGGGGFSYGASPAGTGVVGTGGANTTAGPNGVGVTGYGGANNIGSGGQGIMAIGGSGYGTGQVGGAGIEATGGEGNNGATNGFAGVFHGNVIIGGTLIKSGGSFKIDHPLDPANKFLSHSFVESPDMMNIYNGNITTNEKGEAVVEMPAYFQTLNRDFRYQLTVIGTFAQAIVAEKMKGNRFTIKTSAPNVEVSWQVTGIRQDPWANANRIKVEEEKPQDQRGKYLYSEASARDQESKGKAQVKPR